MTSAEIEQLRLQLERERLNLERGRAKREDGLLNRHFGTVITSIVSIAAVLVSFAQIGVAKIQKDREITAEKLTSERRWRIEAANFVISNKAVVFTEDDRERDLINHVISVAFPKEVGEGILLKVKMTRNPDLIRRYWKPDGYTANKTNAENLRAWLDSNDLAGVPLTVFSHGSQFDDARARAVQELQLETRQRTMTNVPGPQLESLTSSIEAEGAEVCTRQQSDGRYTVTATYDPRN